MSDDVDLPTVIDPGVSREPGESILFGDFSAFYRA